MSLKREKLISDDALSYLEKFPNEYNENGYNEFGFGRDGYNQHGWDVEGFDRDGLHFTDAHLTPEERRERQFLYNDDLSPRYDEKGFNAKGYDRDGFDRHGWHFRGFDRNGLTRKQRAHLEKLAREKWEKMNEKQRKTAGYPDNFVEYAAIFIAGRLGQKLGSALVEIASERIENKKTVSRSPTP